MQLRPSIEIWYAKIHMNLEMDLTYKPRMLGGSKLLLEAEEHISIRLKEIFQQELFQESVIPVMDRDQEDNLKETDTPP